MERLVNLVGTRCVDGDHLALRRWYADHVHMLMGFPGLLGATLYHARGEPAPAAPQYLCLYHFASLPDFESYETSVLRAEVEQDRQRGWGRDGIQIVMRTPYQRLYRRQSGAPGSAPALWRIEALRSAAAPSPGAERWLAARAEGSAGFELLRALSSPSLVADYLVLAAPPAERADPAAAPGGLSLAWQCDCEPLLRWER